MIGANLTRFAVGAGGCAAIIWGVITLPIFWRSAPLEQVAARIIDQVTYKTEKLEAL